MTSPFDIATEDIFNNPDFTKVATINGQFVTVIRSTTMESPVLSEFGLDEGVSFFLRVQVSGLTAKPKQNDLISFGGTEYRISSCELDSCGLTYKIDLKSKSSR